MPQGNGDIVRTRELYEVERRIKGHIDDKLDDLDSRYVLHAACNERHKLIDPAQIWKSSAISAVIASILVMVIGGIVLTAFS